MSSYSRTPWLDPSMQLLILTSNVLGWVSTTADGRMVVVIVIVTLESGSESGSVGGRARERARPAKTGRRRNNFILTERLKWCWITV